ncbi:DUF6357 family protein [Phytomonospora sp. NPDC050363]|uniref:DUF6357 family protein n=1 Tax=Phytomonospora sp. NPDC050363 TaxID=3155642 RepID=UPI0033D2913E
MRALTFSDDKGNEAEWAPGGPQPAFDAFQEFVDRHRGDGATTLRVEDRENGEALLFLPEAGAVCRTKGAPDTRTEYRPAGARDRRAQLALFAHRGFSGLDRQGTWFPDLAGLARERIREEFDASVLRRTHPRELRRRLEILTRADGRETATVDGVTHYGFGAGGGDTVNAWFGADGRGLVVVFDHAGALNRVDDPDAHAALYDGIPADLLDLVKDVPEAGTALNVAHPGGGTLAAATGVFSFAGPCAMADGVVAGLQEAGLGVEETGLGRLLERFLAMGDFTPAGIAEAAERWSAADVEKGFAAATALEQERTAPLDRETLNRFCRIWADSGYNDRWDTHYVLFDGDTLEDVGEIHDELLALVETLGLERVDSPPRAADGEVWIRTDPRVDAELERWS